MKGSFANVNVPAHLLGVASLVCAFVSLTLALHAVLCDPRSLPHRLVTAHRARISRALRIMFVEVDAGYVVAAQGVFAVVAIAASVFLKSTPMLFVAAVCVLLPGTVVRLGAQRTLAKIDGQVPEFALALANALKATASIGDAFQSVAEVTPRQLRNELRVCSGEVRLGSSMDEALLAMAGRVDAPSLSVLVSALLIGRKMGGDLPRALETVAASLREMKRLEEVTDAMARSARTSLWVAAATTAGTAYLLPRFLPAMFEPVMRTTQGKAFVVQCTILFLFALFLGVKYTRKEI